eukprot:Em0521g6a
MTSLSGSNGVGYVHVEGGWDVFKRGESIMDNGDVEKIVCSLGIWSDSHLDISFLSFLSISTSITKHLPYLCYPSLNALTLERGGVGVRELVQSSIPPNPNPNPNP